MQKLPIEKDGRQVSHLAVRLDRAADPRADDLCCLYCHGFGSQQSGEKADFFRQRSIQHGLDFCSFDFQGHGESGGSMFELSATRNLADIALARGWLESLGYERLIVCGSSMGGLIAMWHAALRPRGIVAGLYIAPALAMARGLRDLIGPQGMEEWRRTGKHALTHDLGTWDLGWQLMEDLEDYGFERLKTLYRTPGLILQGKHDTSVPWRTAVELIAECPYEAIELHLIADGDHRLIDRKPHLWRLMVSFLEARGVMSAAGRGA